MKKFNFFLIFLTALLCKGFSQDLWTNEDLICRFILKSDEKKSDYAGLNLPAHWWSRTYEYAWAAKFTNKDLVVLDAACGIDHPFKWFLTENSKETWACDIDRRILNFNYLIHQYGKEVYEKIKNKVPIWQTAHLVHCSICSLTADMPMFDRIFCISTLEHMQPMDRKQALCEFAKKLSQDGLIIITVDYPTINPKELLRMAEEAGLIPAKEVDLSGPFSDALNGNPYYPSLYIYRIVLKHKFL